MPYRIPPFKILAEQVGLRLEFNNNPPEEIDKLNWTYETTGAPDPIEIGFKVEFPGNWKDLIPPAEHANPKIDVTGVVKCRRGRKSFSLPLAGTGPSRSGVLTIPRRLVAGELIVEALLTRRDRAIQPQQNLAASKAAVLATSKRHTILVTPEPEVKGGDLETRWEAFRDLGPPASNYQSALHYLDLKSPHPVLYLNDQVSSDLRRLLGIELTRGKKADVRDAFLAPIVADVWEQLVTHSLKEIKGNSSLDDIEVWEKRVIETVAIRLTGKSDQKDAEREIINDCQYPEKLQSLIDEKLPLVVQEKAEMESKLSKVSEEHQ